MFFVARNIEEDENGQRRNGKYGIIRCMRVWIENPFDNLPAEGFRPQRYWLMAEAFAKAGHDVTLWTSDFSHAKKAPRVITPFTASFRLKLVKTPPYRSNVSFARIRSHRAYARRWLSDAREYAAANGKPDLIIVSLPPLSTASAALAMKRDFGAKLGIDVMDAWPETFRRLFPEHLHCLAPLALYPLSAAAKRAYREADFVTGVCDAYGPIALSAGAKSYTRFYHGIARPSKPVSDKYRTRAPLSIVYAGNFGRGYDLTTAIRAVREMAGATLDIAGAGEREAEWRECAANSPRVRFRGYLSSEDLGKLLDSASIGVIPLSDDTFVGLPYKLGDYAAHGLKMVTSLRGECAALLEKHGAGASYRPNDVASFKDAVAKAMAQKADFPALLAELDAKRIYSEYVAHAVSRALCTQHA